jgi:methylthioribose-1-phosphate isomerase
VLAATIQQGEITMDPEFTPAPGDSVRLSDDRQSVVIIDQTELPGRLVHRTVRTPDEIFEAIATLRVRGAPAIGICAAYGIYCIAQAIPARDARDFLSKFHRQKTILAGARPTAVNLGWALDRMEAVVAGHLDMAIPEILHLLENECHSIHREDIAMCKAIAEHGLALLRDGDGVLTHCNAGPLATSRYGTALGPLILGHSRGMNFRVFADETRPLLQGARLTTYELQQAGVDVTLICDSMAGLVMKNGWVQACLVGCDRIAANGDTANKIGTSSLAILARYYSLPFYVLGPTSSIDLDCPTGDAIVIEQRPPDEIHTKFFAQPMAPAGIPCYNPAFDVTDHSLISGIVTEKGICREPYFESLADLFRP